MIPRQHHHHHAERARCYLTPSSPLPHSQLSSACARALPRNSFCKKKKGTALWWARQEVELNHSRVKGREEGGACERDKQGVQLLLQQRLLCHYWRCCQGAPLQLQAAPIYRPQISGTWRTWLRGPICAATKRVCARAVFHAECARVVSCKVGARVGGSRGAQREFKGGREVWMRTG